MKLLSTEILTYFVLDEFYQNKFMPSKVYSAAIVGLDAKPVEVEIDVSHGLRSFSIVGLGDRAVEESSVMIKHSNYF